jgi:hypothetical protein
VIRLIREIVIIDIAAFVYDHSDLIDKEIRREHKQWNSNQKAWLRRRDKAVRQAERAEIKRREFIESSRQQPIYRLPWRPSNWNLKDYRRWDVRLRHKSGGFIKADCQQGGPVRYPTEVAVASLVPTKTQRLYKRMGRLYKEDCHQPLILGVPFDQSPSAYLYPEHAPAREITNNKVVECPARWNYQGLLADQTEHNAKYDSFWNNTGISRRSRSLNIPHETAVTNGIENRQHQAPSLPQLAADKVA